jgi:hypothetical protein
MTVFSVQAGVAVRLAEPPATDRRSANQQKRNPDIPLKLVVEGIDNAYQFFSSIVTSVTLERAENHNIMHTLSDFVYAFAFGARVSPLIVSGVSFRAACEGMANTRSRSSRRNTPGGHGIENVISYYETYRLSQYGKPVTVQLGTRPSGTMLGLLTHMRAEVISAESQLASFTLRFEALPQPTSESQFEGS